VHASSKSIHAHGVTKLHTRIVGVLLSFLGLEFVGPEQPDG